MSLNDLITRYTPERSLDEKLQILSSIAAGLPAPEFLWMPIALEAFKSHDRTLRLASLRLLAFAPSRWDEVLVAGLTTPDAEFQTTAIAALATMAAATPNLLEPFGAIGQLPGWQAPSRDAWARAWMALKPAEEARSASQAAAEWERRVQALERAKTDASERADAFETRARALEATLELERREAAALREQLAEQAETASEEHSLQQEIAQLEKEIESRRFIYDELTQAHERTLEGMHQRQRRWMSAAGTAVALVILGVPGGWALGSRSAMRAEEPPRAIEVPSASASEAVAEAEDAGYRQALQALAERASQHERQGELSAATTAWRLYAGLAKTPAEAKFGQDAASRTIAALKRDAAPARPAITRPAAAPVVQTRPAAPVQRAAPAVTPRRAAPPVSQPPAAAAPPAAPAPSDEAIPAHIRAKF